MTEERIKVGDEVLVRGDKRVGTIDRIDVSPFNEHKLYYVRFKHFSTWYKSDEIRLATYDEIRLATYIEIEDLSYLGSAVYKWLSKK